MKGKKKSKVEKKYKRENPLLEWKFGWRKIGFKSKKEKLRIKIVNEEKWKGISIQIFQKTQEGTKESVRGGNWGRLFKVFPSSTYSFMFCY